MGIKVTKDKHSYLIRQTNLQNSKDSDIPTYHKQPYSLKLSTNEKYRTAIRCLLYISTIKRSDNAAAVNILSQNAENPSQAD